MTRQQAEYMSREARVASWPAIESALRETTAAYIKGKNRTIFKRYYIDEQYPEGMEEQLNLSPGGLSWIRLLCEPNATQERWASIFSVGQKNDTSIIGRRARVGELKTLQNVNSPYYFGHNSILACRDHELYEYYFKGVHRSVQKDMVDKFGWINKQPTFAYAHNPAYSKSASRNPNPYRVSWRFLLDDLDVGGSVVPSCLKYFSSDQLFFRELSALAQFKLGLRYPEQFSDRFIELCREVDHFMVNGYGPETLRQLYNDIDQPQLDCLASRELFGARVHFCARYDTAELLEAVLAQLDPSTRFPYGSPVTESTALFLPPLQSSNECRGTKEAMYALWSSGVDIDTLTVIDERTLYISWISCGTVDNLVHVRLALMTDLRDLSERILARKTLPGDNLNTSRLTGQSIMLFEPLSGESSVSAYGLRKAGTFKVADDEPTEEEDVCSWVALSDVPHVARELANKTDVVPSLVTVLEDHFESLWSQEAYWKFPPWVAREHPALSSLFESYVRVSDE